jgi:triosephosphate isomerase
MRRKLVAGNWKMHGALAQNETLLDAVAAGMAQMSGLDCAVCVPFPYLAQTQQRLSKSTVQWGAQDVHPLGQGAFTGEVSASMLKDFGCHYVIVGHSERRSLYGESSELVAEKFAAAQEAGLIPILCIGETLAQHDAGTAETVVAEQLDAVTVTLGARVLHKAVLAYEPVWAIGTGKTATPEQAQAMHAFIRRRITAQDVAAAQAVRILYGGSVKAANAADLFAMPDIDGGLIGGASLQAGEFLAICRAAQN